MYFESSVKRGKSADLHYVNARGDTFRPERGDMAYISGAHSIIYSTNPAADRAFFRDVLKAPSVDVGGGWLIFGLPPSEVAVHPADKNGMHAFYLMCDDVEGFVIDMQDRDVVCGPIRDQGWGLLTEVTLPGGGKLGVYQPRHARPRPMAGAAAPRKARRPTKKAPKRAKKAPKPATKKAGKKATKRGKR